MTNPWQKSEHFFDLGIGTHSANVTGHMGVLAYYLILQRYKYF